MQRALSVSRMTGNRSTFPEWYQAVVREADLAENSPVRGMMIIKPWGYGVWEEVQRDLDRRIKETGHVNAYFPLLGPDGLADRFLGLYQPISGAWRGPVGELAVLGAQGVAEETLPFHLRLAAVNGRQIA